MEKAISNLQNTSYYEWLVFDIYNRLSMCYLAENSIEKAALYNQKAREACQDNMQKIAQCQGREAAFTKRRGNLQLAIKQYQTAIDTLQNTTAPLLLAELTSDLAHTYEDCDEIYVAYKLNKEAVKICEQSDDPFNPRVATYLTNLASTAIRLGSWSEAAGYIDRALEVERSYSKDGSVLHSKLVSLKAFVKSHLTQAH